METNSKNLIGKTLGTCTLESLNGQGGMRAVYLARQIRPSRYVAVKILLPIVTIDSQMTKEFLARFRQEADVIARLDHINIMPIFEYGELDGLAYLVMPHLPGGSLRDVLTQKGALPLQDAAKYINSVSTSATNPAIKAVSIPSLYTPMAHGVPTSTITPLAHQPKLLEVH